MNIKLFLDGANLDQMKEFVNNPQISGFTTNPSLMKQAGVKDYASFAKEAIQLLENKPISFEVFSDELDKMESEARIINSWGGNTYIKIPIMNTKGISTIPLIRKLSEEGFSLNVTAVMTQAQVDQVLANVSSNSKTILSIFAGRIADTGVDPMPLMLKTSQAIKSSNLSNVELLWASTRELFNIMQAEQTGCHIITVPANILNKLSYIGKNLHEFSRETVVTFYNDAKIAGFSL